MFASASRLIRNSQTCCLRNYGIIRRPRAVYDDEGNNLLTKSNIDPIEPMPRISEATGEERMKKHKQVKPSRSGTYSKMNRKASLERKVKKIDTKLASNYDVIKSFISLNQRTYFSKNNPYTLLEGERLIFDAIQTAVPIKGIYYANNRTLESFKLISKALAQHPHLKATQVLESDLKIATKVVTSPGIVAIVSKPTREDIEKYRSSLTNQNILPVTVVAAGLRDPTNMGGLIRSAAAAGVNEVITVPPSVNIWNDKVVRTAAGTHFKVFISEATELNDLITRLESADSIICCESHGGQNFFDMKVSPSANTAVIVGCEADGIPIALKEALEREPLKSKTQLVSIAMSNGVESLNNYVSASIILFHLKRLLKT